jgi:hypothetical protein
LGVKRGYALASCSTAKQAAQTHGELEGEGVRDKAAQPVSPSSSALKPETSVSEKKTFVHHGGIPNGVFFLGMIRAKSL